MISVDYRIYRAAKLTSREPAMIDWKGKYAAVSIKFARPANAAATGRPRFWKSARAATTLGRTAARPANLVQRRSECCACEPRVCNCANFFLRVACNESRRSARSVRDQPSTTAMPSFTTQPRDFDHVFDMTMTACGPGSVTKNWAPSRPRGPRSSAKGACLPAQNSMEIVSYGRA